MKIWLISRLDQSVSLAEYLNECKALTRWDTFTRFSKSGILGNTRLGETRRCVQHELLSVPGNHIVPDLVNRVARVLRRKSPNLYSDLLLAKLARASHHRKFDILHGQGNYSLESGVYARKNKKIFISEVSGQMGITREKQLAGVYSKFNKKLVVGNPILQKRRLEEARIADAIICPSESVLIELVELGIDVEKIFIAYYETPYIKELLSLGVTKEVKKTVTRKRILYVGNVSVDKGVGDLVEAVSRLLRKGFNIEVYCVGPIVDEFLVYDTDHRINFVGKKNKRQLTEFYLSADVFVFPSYTEGSSLATYEAMAVGLPIVTTTAAGSLIENGKDGIVVSPGNVESIVDGIQTLLTDGKKCAELGCLAQKKIKAKLQYGYGERVMAIYDKVLQNTSRRK